MRLFHQRGELKDQPPGTELFTQGHPIRHIYLIERGVVKLTHTDMAGHEMIVVLRPSGRMLGATSVILDNPAPASAVTLTACQVRCLSAEVFSSLLENDIEFLHQVLHAISQNSYEQTIHLSQLGTVSARSRLAYLLLQFIPDSAQDQGGEIRLKLPVTKADLARLLAISPEHLSRKLGELEKMGIIRRSKGWIYVRSLERLAQEAE